MPNVRKPKTTLAAWIVEQRKRLDWKSEELAARLDASPTTVRGWEAGRSVSQDNLERLERLFGREAPGREETPSGDFAAAIREQTAVLVELIRSVAAAAPSKSDQPTGRVPAKVRASRRGYWIERARDRLRITTEADAMSLLGWPSTKTGRLGRLQKGAEPTEGELRDLARAFRIPESVLRDPPPTDAERLAEWEEISLVQVPEAERPATLERRRRTA